VFRRGAGNGHSPLPTDTAPAFYPDEGRLLFWRLRLNGNSQRKHTDEAHQQSMEVYFWQG
jgi:hypothetical protein